ncbi:MAG: hypothetical protein AB7J46_06305 [Candidatus Altimarinota bacterium]
MVDDVTIKEALEPADAVEDPAQKKRIRRFKKDLELCKTQKKELMRDWRTNVDYRRGKAYATASDRDRIAVPLDWSLTKEKEAVLFSQIPAIRVNHPPQTISEEALPWVHRFEQKLNDLAIEAGIESAMNEVLPDCINAAGFGVVIVAREAITDTVMMPAIDLSIFPPELQQMILSSGMLPTGEPIPMVPTPRTLDSRYTVTRISPADFLWPIAFDGSDFDKAPWIGRSGRISWAEAVQRFGLEEDEKRRIIGDSRSTEERIDWNSTASGTPAESDLFADTVEFDEIFYKAYHYDQQATNFSHIHHMVFVKGKDNPVIDEPWQGQMEDEESGLLLGAQKYPIRVLTLAYITDDAIPPSDSAVGRAQVDELNKSRTNMMEQRQHSLPVNWFDVNRVDPTIQYALMRGQWQGYVPVQGVGQNIIGSVARSSYPQDHHAIDQIVKNDLNQVWQVGSGMFGPDVETGKEASAINSGMQIRVARERARVGKFFVGIMEVLGGLVSIFEDPAEIGEGFTPLVSRTLAYSILADSTVLLDSNQRLENVMRFVNFFAKSGWVDIESLVKEAATLSGLDPAVVVRPPSPKPPVEPNISLRFTGVEDVLNPLILAFLLKSGQAPDEKLIERAKELITSSVAPPEGQDPNAGFGLTGIEGEALPSRLMSGPAGMSPDLAQLVTQLQSVKAPKEVPAPPPPEVGAANPRWGILGRMNRRADNGDED